MANKITVTSLGTTANVNATPDSTRYYSDKSKEWAISDKIVDNTDYSSKYYANESKKQADISTAKTTEVIESGNNAVSNIESARDEAIVDVNTAGATQVSNINTAGATQVANINSAGTTQVNLAKEQVTLATNQANIAKEQANIATSQASIATSKTTEVVKSGNTALSNIETAKNNALNDINTTGTEYVNNAKQYAQNALNSANNAKTSETNAKSSETRCEEIFSRLGTAIKIKGRVDSLSDLPLSGNLDGDAYLVGEEGLDSYPEYYWYQDHWEFLGTSGTSLSWGLITGDITAQTDLQTALNSKQDIISDLETIRSGASLGATALQEETDPVYMTDKPNIALKSEIPDVSNFAYKNEIPIVPVEVSAFVNDIGYLTEHQDISGKQDTLVSGTNIKTINGMSILGEGDITIEGGGGQTDIGLSIVDGILCMTYESEV